MIGVVYIENNIIYTDLIDNFISKIYRLGNNENENIIPIEKDDNLNYMFFSILEDGYDLMLSFDNAKIYEEDKDLYPLYSLREFKELLLENFTTPSEHMEGNRYENTTFILGE